jgi:hypothetical protein
MGTHTIIGTTIAKITPYILNSRVDHLDGLACRLWCGWWFVGAACEGYDSGILTVNLVGPLRLSTGDLGVGMPEVSPGRSVVGLTVGNSRPSIGRRRREQDHESWIRRRGHSVPQPVKYSLVFVTHMHSSRFCPVSQVVGHSAVQDYCNPDLS